MDLKAFIEKTPIDWDKAIVQPDDGPIHSECPFNLAPQDFITFAKADIFGKDLRGLINGLSNAKRAIDCQADSFISCLGLDPKNLAKQLGTPGLEELKNSPRDVDDSPLKFRLLAALGVATPAIISRMRRLRNILEHEYRKPRRRDVCDAIDVAELFIQACNGHLRSAWQTFSISSGVTNVRHLGIEEAEVQISLCYEPEPNAHFVVRSRDLRKFIGSDITSEQGKLMPGEIGFVAALKLLFLSDINRDLSKELRDFLRETNVCLPNARMRRRTPSFPTGTRLRKPATISPSN